MTKRLRVLRGGETPSLFYHLLNKPVFYPRPQGSVATYSVVFILLFSLVFAPIAPIFAQVDEATEPVVGETSDTVSIENKENLSAPEALDTGTADSNAPQQSLLTTGDSQKQIEKTNYTQNIPKVDGSTGALSFAVPIGLPAGRGDASVALNLRYSSQDTRPVNIIGRGWSLDIPEIRRVNATGSQNLFTDDVFESSVSGKLVYIQTNGDGSKMFAPRIEGPEKMSYKLTTNGDGSSSWAVIDSRGVISQYGSLSSSRHDDPANNTKIYRWMIDTVTDLNGNYIRYSYTKAAGQIYPDSISYPNHPSVPTTPFSVNFSWSTVASVPQFDTGFRIDAAKRLSGISVSSLGTTIRQYAIARVPADSSLISSVTESYRNASGTTVSLSPTVFTYPSTSEASGWEPRLDWQFTDPGSLPPSTSGGTYRAMELDGNGLTDFVYGNYTLRNYGNGNWETVLPGNGPRAYKQQASDELLDLNGDGLSDYFFVGGSPTEDAVSPNTFISRFYLNNAGQFIEDAAHPTLPPQVYMNHTFSGSVIDNGGVRTLDMNGDGVVDLIQGLKFSTPQGSPQSIKKVYGGIPVGPTGYNWQEISWPGMPFIEADPLSATLVGTEGMLTFADVNGDGLVDVLRNPDPQNQAAYNHIKADLNTGASWNTTDIVPWFFSTDLRNDILLTADVNSDGFEDLITYTLPCQSPCTNQRKVFLGTGTGFVDASSSWQVPSIAIKSDTNGTRFVSLFADINGDTAPDLIIPDSQPAGVARVYLNKSAYALLPKTIQLPTGATLDIAYQSSTTNTGNDNPNLPLPLKTVASVTTTVNGVASTESYRYQHGLLLNQNSGLSDAKYRREKIVAFGKTTKTRADGSTVTTFYHQGNTVDSTNLELTDHLALANRQYREDIASSTGAILKRTLYREGVVNLTGSSTTGHWFVSPEANVVIEYGSAAHKASAEQYVYDSSTGNINSAKNWGEVTVNANGSYADVAGDDSTTTYLYATWSAGPFNGQPSPFAKSERITNSSAILLQETKRTYDLQAFGFVSKGNETKTEQWATGSTYAVTQKTYDGVGLVTTVTDPLNHSTTTVYDSAKMYPATVTNALNQVTSMTYDTYCGVPTLVTDPNGAKTKTTVDGLCRTTKIEVSDPTASGSASQASLVLKETTTYTDTANAASIDNTQFFDGTLSVRSLVYLDGLGRTWQTRASSETTGQWSAADTAYDSVGHIWKQSVPYFSSGTSRTTATTDNALLKVVTYDALDRPIQEVTSVATTTSSYGTPWQTTVTDGNGHTKDYVRDALGRLRLVREMNQGQTYTTQYGYDALGRLLLVTDAEGNVRNFTYNGLGYRLTAEDLHHPTDTTFGLWIYAYDLAGNLSTLTQPTGTVLSYTYDELNRAKTETPPSSTGLPPTVYGYDTCLNGIGYVCSVSKYNYTKTIQYNPAGLPSREWQTILDVPYITNFTYNRQKKMTSVTTPDVAEQTYGYNTAGLLEWVKNTESGGAINNVITSFAYNANGNPTTITYGNGVVTTDTYDATKLYRLTQRRTVSPRTTGLPTFIFGPVLQDITYTYDAVGNIKTVADISDTNTKKNATYNYDDLDRLLSATITNSRQASQNYTESYTYSPLGNLLTKTLNGALTRYCYDGNAVVYAGCPAPNLNGTWANPHAATKIGSVAYTYDKNGNQTNAGSDLYSWTPRNELGLSLVGGQIGIQWYDENGERIYQAKATTGVAYPNRWFNRDTGGAVVKHLFAEGVMVGTITGSGAQAAITSQHLDHLGGQAVTGDTTGLAVEVAAYAPYGETNLNNKSGTFTEQRKYVGEERDSSGLSYLHARYYDPKGGRFISQDPAFLSVGDRKFESQFERPLSVHLANPQALNAYSYSENNPIAKKDPRGEIAPILALAWAALEISASAYDYYDTARTFQSPTATKAEKAISAGGLVLGLVAPGGGYGTVGKKLLGKAEEAVAAGREMLRYQRAIGAPHIWDPNPRIRNAVKNVIKHWNDHGKEFPELRNAKEYVEAAWKNVTSPAPGTLYKSLERNRGIYYDVKSQIFTFTQNGIPSSMYRPQPGIHPYGTNTDYFNSLR